MATTKADNSLRSPSMPVRSLPGRMAVRVRLTFALPLLIVVLMALQLGVQPAAAHAVLISAEPAINATVQEPPRELTLYFSEPLERKFSSVSVTDQDGQRLEEQVRFDDDDGSAMRVTIGESGAGYLLVSWETVSVVDGHRITGSYPITILNADGSPPATPPPAGGGVQGDNVQPGLVAAKFLLLAGGSLLAGVLLFAVWITPAFRGAAGERARQASDRRGAQIALLALGVAAAGAALELAVQSTTFGSSVTDILTTRWGERWLLRGVFLLLTLAAVALVALRNDRPWPRRHLALAGLLTTAVALLITASTSHAAASAGAFWAIGTDFVHLLAASVWIGMLMALVGLFAWARATLTPEDRHPVLVTALRRFSLAAVLSVALLMLTGTLSALVEVDRVRDLVESAYGRALLIKLALIVPLLAVGGFNAYVLHPRYAAASSTRDAADAPPDTIEASERWLARLAKVESALALVVLAAVAILVQISPQAAAANDQAQPFTEAKQIEQVSVSLSVEPNVPGFNTFEVLVGGEVSSVEQVRLEFFDRTGVISGSRLALEPSAAAGAYGGQGPFLASRGEWQVRVNLRQSQGSDLSVPFDLLVGGEDRARARDGAFASPIDWDSASVLIAAASLFASAVLIVFSLRRRPEMGGRLGKMIRRLARVRPARR